MSYHPALLKGIALFLAAEGFGIYRESAVYGATERGIVVQAFPETPNEIIAVSLYLPGGQKLTPTASHQLSEALVQIRWRLAGHPFEGLAVFDNLHDLIDRRTLILGDVTVTGAYRSFSPMGRDRNNRLDFTSNWAFTGLKSI